MFVDPVRNEKKWEKTLLQNTFSKEKEGAKCGPFGSALKKHEYVSDGVPVWNMDNITTAGFIKTGYLFITEEKYQELKTYSVSDGDIIISRAGPVGKMCVVRGIKSPSIISTNLIRLSLDSELIPESCTIFIKSRARNFLHDCMLNIINMLEAAKNNIPANPHKQ